jgi:ribosome-binding ATPase YchF (GTP1/OBG family)
MEIGVVGKTNTGKSSFFKAATMIDVEISDRTFVTIKPNIGVTYVSAKCVCEELKLKCNPKNSQCINHIRLIPVKLLDVAGLVPGAHEGKGLGNQFLNDLIPADVLIHIVDASGRTNEEGKPTDYHDPSKDVRFLENEIDLWFESVIRRNLEKLKSENKLEVLTGLGIRRSIVEEAVAKAGYEVEKLARELRRLSKPILIAANKIDIESSDKNMAKMIEEFPDVPIIPCSAEAEIALRTAAKNGIIEYVPGSNDFKILKELNEQQKKGLEFLREKVLKKYGSTGIQDCLNKVVFNFLRYIVVYPVENEHKFTDKKGNILPEAYLMPPNSTAIDLAYRIHTDIGKHFIGAIDARTKKRVSADYQLKNGDIISILTSK